MICRTTNTCIQVRLQTIIHRITVVTFNVPPTTRSHNAKKLKLKHSWFVSDKTRLDQTTITCIISVLAESGSAHMYFMFSSLLTLWMSGDLPQRIINRSRNSLKKVHLKQISKIVFWIGYRSTQFHTRIHQLNSPRSRSKRQREHCRLRALSISA